MKKLLWSAFLLLVWPAIQEHLKARADARKSARKSSRASSGDAGRAKADRRVRSRGKKE